MVRRRRWSLTGAAALCVLVLVAQAQPARAADGGASWVSAPALAPPPPTGAGPPPYPVPIGHVSDIQFWAPNRGLLMTAGNAVVPMGLYAYDGVNWHQLSTVCGATDGRIAWAGPDEFWTIADQRPGQVTGGLSLQNLSLCHFQNGQVVGSYAMPVGQPNSYSQMTAAACDAPSDCWFGGQLKGNGMGAFHLHWDGTNVSVVDGAPDHAIASMTVDRGQIFESVALTSNDVYGSENIAHPPLMHLIAPNDPANPFHSLYPADTQDPTCGHFCPPLPEYGTSSGLPVDPATLNGLALSSDWRAGAADPQLWAAAGWNGSQPATGQQGTANPVVLRYADGTWTQVVPNLVKFPTNDSPAGKSSGAPVPQSVAAEPGQSAAWIAVTTSNPDNEAHLDRIAVTGGTPPATVTDQVALGTAQGVGPQGPASAVACPAPQDCWVATSEGWLFHLTDGTQLPQDTDPNFAGVITYRPPDGGVPSVVLDQPLGQDLTPPPTVVPPPPTVHHHRRGKALVTHMGRARLVHRTTLVLSFTLTARARVRLIARRHHRIVAETPRLVLKAGRHTLKLRLDPRHWPTKLALQAKALTTSARA